MRQKRIKDVLGCRDENRQSSPWMPDVCGRRICLPIIAFVLLTGIVTRRMLVSLKSTSSLGVNVGVDRLARLKVVIETS